MLDTDHEIHSSERFAILSDTHLSPPGTSDGVWNNVTKRSASASLLHAAVAQIVAGGLGQVLVLGDVSEFGTHDMITTALRAISDAGLSSWVVPGNHDVTLSSNAVTSAAKDSINSMPLQTHHHAQSPAITVFGHGLRSHDGGQSCNAIDLPDLTRVRSRLVVWASHYPILSQRARLRIAGLRYPGDLLNLSEVRATVERFEGPILVLHGHLHAAVIRHCGRILQIGSPAVVEWPHAWTDVAIEVSRNIVTVRTALITIPGKWSAGDVDTILAARQQNWEFTVGGWRRTAPEDGE